MWTLWKETLIKPATTPLAIGAVAYLPCVFGLQHYMQSRPAFELKTPLLLWNLGLSLFSWWMASEVVPLLIAELRGHGSVSEQLCDPTVYERDARSWAIFVFNATKCVEWVSGAHWLA